MIRGSAADEKEEYKMQDFLFKLNTIMFIGTVIAIRAGELEKIQI